MLETQHFWSLDDVHLEDVWLTIGSFDGVHLGHQSLISKLANGAHEIDVPAVVVTFFPHPSSVLRGLRPQFYLTTPEERSNMLSDLGVDVVITHPFNQEIAQLTAFEFVQMLHQHLKMKKIFVGHDFALGRDRKGNVKVLTELGAQFKYQVDVIPPLLFENIEISSSMIRTTLKQGDVETVNQLLGCLYTVEGLVIPGDGRGRILGIPTANLDIWSEKAIPKAGVYVCLADTEGKVFGAVTNIGVRPTFEVNRSSLRMETHLLDFDGDLYNKRIKLNFIKRLRDEMKFRNAIELADQIRLDIDKACEVLVQEELGLDKDERL